MTNADVGVGMLATYACLEVLLWWNVVAGPRPRRPLILYYAIFALFPLAIMGSAFVQGGLFFGSAASEPAPWSMVCIIGALLTCTGSTLTYRIIGALRQWRRQRGIAGPSPATPPDSAAP